jgi:hypothetical protein
MTARRAWLLLPLALLQIAGPLVPAIRDNAFTRPDRLGEPAIVPAGYTFAIWGLIEAVSLGWALWSLARPTPLGERLAGPLAVVFAGFTLWLLAVTFVDPNWLTLVIFLGMFAGLLAALRTALGARAEVADWSLPARGLLWGVLGLYTGWTSVAVWANLTTALVSVGAPVAGPVGVAGQLAVLAGAAATAAAILRWTGGLLPYAGAVLWAFVGVALGAAGAGEPVLTAAAAGAAALVLGLTAALRLPRPGPRRRGPVPAGAEA